ncbi:ABC transporter substrate-binding protein [Streptomyces sp. Isolate_219]|uniref:ABC transporter substrate-binding protein n=1 Tax=Streptomyces sp. Isolate_219 TaxID=2950110 RepID=UPI0021C62D19|nr:ABC transporter substrate-binding protein [Streptomyces sp. Isolate_219]MCR8579187.1 ABC transporter substrate-binding protein [Streptomyces sp. Isolate_219]
MRPWKLCGVAAVVALAATACGSGAGGGPGTDQGAPGKGGAGFPVRVADCQGAITTFAAAPRRIVTSNAAALEMLLRLGAGDRVIGTGFPPGKGTLPGGLEAKARKVPVLSKSVIPKEKLLGSGADLYIDSFAAMKTMGGAGDAPTAEEFTAAGIKHLYLASTACAPMAKKPQRDLSGVEADIKRLGAVTGTAERADALVAGMRAKTGKVRRAVGDIAPGKRPTYFFFDYDAGTKQPVAVCRKQVANAVIGQAGARNVFEGCDGDFKPVSWEDVVATNPDWIQLGVRNRGDAAANAKAYDEAAAFLKSFPATKGLAAVRNGKFLRIGSERTTIAGVGNADTVEEIAHTIHPARFKAAR